MGNFSKDIYMKGCRLIIRMYGDTSDMYQFVFNPEEADFSDIYACNEGLEFEIEEDGTYRVVTFRNPNAVLIDGKIKIGPEIYSSEDIADRIKDDIAQNMVYIGEYDFDSVLSICKLKKCLAELELKTFQEMLKNCGDIKCKDKDNVKAHRDFLFIAVWLIEHYIELGNIERAQNIYDSLKGCGNLCKNLINDKRSCGCNG